MTEEYPECEKWAKAHTEVMTIQAFKEFLNSKGYVIGRWGDSGCEFYPICATDSEDLLYEFVGVDWKKLEAERKRVLATVRGVKSE